MISALLLASLSEQEEPRLLGSLTGAEALACSSTYTEGGSSQPGGVDNIRTQACAAAVDHLRKIDPETYKRMNWDTFTLQFKQRLNRMEIDFVPIAKSDTLTLGTKDPATGGFGAIVRIDTLETVHLPIRQ